MRFLDKPVDLLTKDDLDELRNVERPEGLYLEFKQDFGNRQVARSVAAFANTHGGRLLLGVEADKQRNVITRIPGLPAEEGLQERVKNVVLDSVTPAPLFQPHLIRVDPDCVVLVVDVSESPNAPHLLRSSGQVYIRTPVSSDPVPADDRLTIDRLYTRSQTTRDRIGNWMEEQFSRFYSLSDERNVLVCQRLIPVWSGAPLLPDLFRRSSAERYEGILRTADPFGIGGDYWLEQAGIAGGYLNGQTGSGTMVRLDQNGGLTHAFFQTPREPDSSVATTREFDPPPRIYTNYLSSNLKPLLSVQAEICDSVGFYGSVRLAITIAPVSKVGLAYNDSHGWPMVTRPLSRERLEIERMLATDQLKQDPDRLISGVVREMQRAFGIRVYEPEPEYENQ